MKILYVSQYYPPEIGAPSARVSELSRAWTQEGHDVTVLTGFPNHPTGRVPLEYRSKLWRLFINDDCEGVKVRRTWLVPLPNRKSWQRMINYASFAISATVRGIFLPKPHLVIATSPQLLVGLSGLIIAKLKRVPFIFEVRDLWPESLEAVGVSDKKSLLVRGLGNIASLLYRKADHIVVVTNAFKTHLQLHWNVPQEKITVVVNGVDHKYFQPQIADSATVREFELQGKFVVGYIGTIGNAHGVGTLVELAIELQTSEPDILFLVVGEGADKGRLESLVIERALKNVKICPGQPRARIPSLIAVSQVCLVLLRKSDLFKTVIPTKILEYMSCGRPIVAALEGESEGLIKAADGGICVAPEDAKALAEAIRLLYRNSILAQEYGSHARDYVERELSREGTAQAYLSLLKWMNCSGEQISDPNTHPPSA